MKQDNVQTPHITGRYEQWLESRASAEMKDALEEFKIALQSGAIELPGKDDEPPLFAGGVNYCPNSDFKFSKMAVEVLGTLRTDPGDTNHECYRFYRQGRADDITGDASHALKAVDHSLFAANEGANDKIPIWDRVNGWLSWGSSDSAEEWDVAVRLYNNDVKPSDTWYVRLVLNAETEDLVPDDLEMYVGIWHETAAGQGWIEGDNFELDYEIVGIKGTAEYNYMVEAKTDGGLTLYSQILNVPDVPNVVNAENYPRIRYTSIGGGYIEFKVYRENVATGAFHQIARIRNSNSLVVDDDGTTLNQPANGFPSSTPGPRQAIAYSRNLQVGEFGGEFRTNDFTIRIPDNYDYSETLPGTQHLRIGFTSPTAIDRQIRLDRIFLGPSFNKWSDCPLDPKDANPSTSQTGGIPSSGGGGSPPDAGSGGCIRIDTPVLRLDLDRQQEWLAYAEIPHGDLLENGLKRKNVVRQKQPTQTKTYLIMTFSNGVWIPVTRPHRFRLNAHGDMEAAARLDVGERVWGWTDGKEGSVTIIDKQLVEAEDLVEFGTFALVGEQDDGDHFYIAGFSEDGRSGVFNCNRKAEPGLPELL